MADFLAMRLDAADALAGLDQLAERTRSAVRPAAQAGAQVFYDEVKTRAPIAKSVVTTRGGVTRQPGTLKASIYQAFSEDNSNDEKATYHISWNRRKAPHGHLIEYGHFQYFVAVQTADGSWITLKDRPLTPPRWIPAYPFLRPAFDTMKRAALEAARTRLVEELTQ